MRQLNRTYAASLTRAGSAVTALASAVIAMGTLAATPASAAEAFTALKGSWAGAGSASFEGGSKEKLRCSANYSGGGDNLSLNLKCASASAQINLTGSLEAAGSKVSGNWSENSFGYGGDAHGSTNGGTVRLKINGDVTGTLTLNVSGGSHSVAFATSTSSLRGVNVSLSRR